MAYDAITSGEADANSPADATLWGKVKGNFDDLDAARVTNGDSHDHSSGDGAQIPQGGLKTTTGEVSTTSTTDANLTLPGGEYGFYPHFKNSNGGSGTFWGRATGQSNAAGVSTTSYITAIYLHVDGNTGYARQRYIQSSPPYMLGDAQWGHFLFLLRKFGTGEVVSTYQAKDPSWAYNGLLHLPKDHKDRIAEVPHPFCDYWNKDPATDGLEIVLVDLSGVDVTRWLADNWKLGKSILEDLGSVLTGKGADKPWSNYNVPTISRFTDRVKVITP